MATELKPGGPSAVAGQGQFPSISSSDGCNNGSLKAVVNGAQQFGAERQRALGAIETVLGGLGWDQRRHQYGAKRNLRHGVSNLVQVLRSSGRDLRRERECGRADVNPVAKKPTESAGTEPLLFRCSSRTSTSGADHGAGSRKLRARIGRRFEDPAHRWQIGHERWVHGPFKCLPANNPSPRVIRCPCSATSHQRRRPWCPPRCLIGPAPSRHRRRQHW
jgi:hypothetical protein